MGLGTSNRISGELTSDGLNGDRTIEGALIGCPRTRRQSTSLEFKGEDRVGFSPQKLGQGVISRRVIEQGAGFEALFVGQRSQLVCKRVHFCKASPGNHRSLNQLALKLAGGVFHELGKNLFAFRRPAGERRFDLSGPLTHDASPA
jgi:hypothetical protein